jgi:hypothetical protein
VLGQFEERIGKAGQTLETERNAFLQGAPKEFDRNNITKAVDGDDNAFAAVKERLAKPTTDLRFESAADTGDLGLLTQGVSGAEQLLRQEKAGTGYTPGMARLDARLMAGSEGYANRVSDVLKSNAGFLEKKSGVNKELQGLAEAKNKAYADETEQVAGSLRGQADGIAKTWQDKANQHNEKLRTKPGQDEFIRENAQAVYQQAVEKYKDKFVDKSIYDNLIQKQNPESGNPWGYTILGNIGPEKYYKAAQNQREMNAQDFAEDGEIGRFNRVIDLIGGTKAAAGNRDRGVDQAFDRGALEADLMRQFEGLNQLKTKEFEELRSQREFQEAEDERRRVGAVEPRAEVAGAGTPISASGAQVPRPDVEAVRSTNKTIKDLDDRHDIILENPMGETRVDNPMAKPASKAEKVVNSGSDFLSSLANAPITIGNTIATANDGKGGGTDNPGNSMEVIPGLSNSGSSMTISSGSLGAGGSGK